MRGRRLADAAASLLVLAFGSYVVVEALRLDYTDQGVPGPGFAPFWIGLGLALAGLAALVGTWRGTLPLPPAPLPEARAGGPGARLPGSVVVAAITVVWVLVAPYAGMIVSLAAFVAAVPAALGLRRLPVLAALAVGVPVGFHVVFERWLGVPLPRGVWF